VGQSLLLSLFGEKPGMAEPAIISSAPWREPQKRVENEIYSTGSKPNASSL
jgi:hypothetical protein